MREKKCVTVVNTSRNQVLAQTVHLATTWRARVQGLGGAPPLSAEEGMLLLPCRQVHMHHMTYPILAVYVDRRGRVLACPILEPEMRGPFCWRAVAVIELMGDHSADVAVGDVLHWYEERGNNG